MYTTFPRRSTGRPPPRELPITVEKLGADSINILELNRLGLLQDYWVWAKYSCRWFHIVQMRVSRWALIMELHRWEYPQHVRISWTKCRFGGERPWFHCPHCDRRAVILHPAFIKYGCRLCVGGMYTSQTKSAAGRRHFTLCKLRLKLGANAAPGSPLPDRPYRMHRKTYDRLRARIELLESTLTRKLRVKQPDYPNLIYYLPNDLGGKTSRHFRSRRSQQ
jgi:hypothetical protein